MDGHEHAPLLQAGPATLTWLADERVAVLRFVEAGVGGGEEADRLTEVLERRLGTDPGPFQLLVDCSQIADVDAAWRTRWAEFFKAHSDGAVVAWFNASPKVQLAILMFRRGVGVRGEAFETETEARDYLAATPPSAR